MISALLVITGLFAFIVFIIVAILFAVIEPFDD